VRLAAEDLLRELAPQVLGVLLRRYMGTLDKPLPGHYRFDAVRVHLLEMARDNESAARRQAAPRTAQAARP
jgi:hypothetical protein